MRVKEEDKREADTVGTSKYSSNLGNTSVFLGFYGGESHQMVAI